MGRRAGPPRIESKGGKLYFVFTCRPPNAARGERVCIPCGTSTAKEAARRMTAAIAAWKAKHPNGRTPPSASKPAGERRFQKVWDLFVDDYCNDPDRKRPASDSYKRQLEEHGHILAVSFETVDDAADPLQVERHKRNRRMAPSSDNEVWRRKARSTTLRHELASLRLFLGWATRKGIITSVPEIVLPPRDDRDAECLSPEEVKLLLSHIPETVERGPTRGRPLRPFFEVMYYQGLRDRTMCLLTCEDYDPKTGTLHVRKEIDKNRFDRTFVVFPETRAILDGMRPNIVPRGSFIFGTAKRWAPIKKAAIAAGLGGRRISEHTLRHSRTTELCSGPDADLAAVAYLLGWRDVATLCARYFHPDKRHADAFVAKVSRK